MRVYTARGAMTLSMIKKIQKELQKHIGTAVPQILATEKPEFGDYATNVAFRLAGERHQAPLVIAQELAKALSNNSLFSKVEAVAPGFVNFWMSDTVLNDGLKSINTLKKKYGNSKADTVKKINIEFVSANPTGPLTMANGGRGGFYGDVLANVLVKVGHKVTREYYVNDAGNQVKTLGESILAELGAAEPAETHYKAGYVKELASTLKKFKKLSAEDIGKKAAAILLKQIQASLKKSGIKYNVFFSEDTNLRKKKELEKTLEKLRARNLTEKKDGAEWLGDNVLIKSDGQPTYFLADLAYHYDKFIKRKFDIAIDIWGADHHGYIARMKKGVEAIAVDPKRLEILITQLVRLMKDGEEVKMSKRTGNFITLDELVEEVGLDAARFFFLMHSLDTHMDFDMNLAKERSQKNPVYYAQYAYVRCLNIVAKAKVAKKKNVGKLVISPANRQLILELLKLPDLISQTAIDYQAHRLAQYALAIARALHIFYEKERVIEADGSVNSARLALVDTSRIVLENLFNVIGISKPKKM